MPLTETEKTDKPTHKALKSLKKKWNAKNINEVIARLIKERPTLKRKITNLQDRIDTLESEGPKGTVEALTKTPEGGEPSTSPKAPPTPVAHPSHPCTFYSEGDTDGLVHCSKDYDRKGVIHRVTPSVCDQCWQRVQQRLQEDKALAKEYPCLRRFQGRDGTWLCVLRPPKADPLVHGLQTCKACQDRLTEEIARRMGTILQPKHFLTCGAREKRDAHAGVLVQCPHGPVDQWQTLDICKEKECPHLKTVQTEI